MDKLRSTRIPTNVLYSCYKYWCKKGEYVKVTQRIFGTSTKQHLKGDWEFKNARPLDNFNPYEFIEFYKIPCGDDDKKKQHKCLVKISVTQNKE